MNAQATQAEPAKPATAAEVNGQANRISAARGIAVAVLIALPFWLLIAVVAFLVF